MKTNLGARTAAHPFDWHLIRSFLAVLDQGSLLGAARLLQISQPTVGRQIAELESQLGMVLFERTGRGVVPTAAAQLLTTAARQMASGAIDLACAVSGAQAQISGTVRITASKPVATYLMPPVLASLRCAHPEVQVELLACDRVSNLLRREADIAVRMVRPEQSSLVARKLGEVGLGAYAHHLYLARSQALNTIHDVAQHDLIGSDTDNTIEQGFHALGLSVDRTKFVLRSDDWVVQWQAIRAGLGVGFCADYLARTDPEVQQVLAGQLHIAPLPMWLAVHREIHTSPRIRTIFDFLAEALPQVI